MLEHMILCVLTLGLLLIVDLRPLTLLEVLGLGVVGGRGTGVE